MSQKLILGITGPISSGKGTIAKYLKEKHGASVYKFSTVLRDILERLSFDITRENLQKLSSVLRQNFREDILAKVIAEDVEKDNNNIIVVDGIRRWADIVHLKQKPNFILTGIDAKPEIRHQRLVVRQENEGDSTKTFNQFLKDQTEEADAEIPEIIKNASEIINNDGDLEELYNNIDKLLAKYGKQY